MKINRIKSIVHDLINLMDWRNPLQAVVPKEKYVLNLITGEKNMPEEDSITELLKEKEEWFKQRVQNLDGHLKDFEKAMIVIDKNKEVVEIVFKGRKFKDEAVYAGLI